MGAITLAMARAARGHGAEIETEAGVREVIVEGGRAVGVILDNGATIRAKYIVSGVNPKLLYTRLVPSGALAPEFLERIARWRNAPALRMTSRSRMLPSPHCPAPATISPPASSSRPASVHGPRCRTREAMAEPERWWKC